MIRTTLVAWALLLLQSASAPSIRGTVTVAGSNEPLAGARVILTESTAALGIPPPAFTDSNGRFAFQDLKAGTYRLNIIKDGFVLENRSIQLAAGKAIDDVLVHLTPGGTVSGHIRNASGHPLANVPVRLQKRVYFSDGVRYQTVESAQTNDLGEYRMFWVEPGRYYLAAGSDDGNTDTFEPMFFEHWILRGDNSVPALYPTTYFPGVTTTEKASVLNIQPGAVLSDIDITVSRQQRYRIRGRVIDSQTGLPPTDISFEWAASNSGERSYDAKTGTFEFTDVLPGEFWFRLIVEDPEPVQAEATVVVGNADVEGLVLKLTPPPVITGHIKVEGELPAASALDGFRVGLRPAGIANRSSPSSAGVQKDGTFILENLDNREFRVGLSGLPSGFYVKEARLDGKDILNAFASFSQSGKIEIAVGAKAGRLEGTVTADHTVKNADIQVVLIPNTSRYRTELYLSGNPDKDGHFNISSVPPGDYKLFAWEGLEPRAWFDPEVLKEFEVRGTSIHVEESSTQNIELRVISAGSTK